VWGRGEGILLSIYNLDERESLNIVVGLNRQRRTIGPFEITRQIVGPLGNISLLLFYV
jgi:hypothetical protein